MGRKLFRERLLRGWLVFAVLWTGAFSYQYYSTEQLRKKAEAHAPFVGLEHAVLQAVDTQRSDLGLGSMDLEKNATPWNEPERLATKSRSAVMYLFGGLILSAIGCLLLSWILYGVKSRPASR
jgi:hypothetical protein